MAATHQKTKINLLPQEEFESSTLGRILKWLLSTFRVIVIATEIVVIGAFLFRFWADAQNSDLTENINQKKSVIASYSQVEKSFRDTQKKLNIFSSLTKEENRFSGLLKEVSSYLPLDVTLTYISITTTDLELRASTASEQSASQTVVNLTSSKLFENVTITSIESKDNIINFSVKANRKT